MSLNVLKAECIGARERTALLGRIFLSFLKIGSFTFGSGYAMLPMLRREAVLKHRWLDEKEMTDFFALSQSLPGSIAVNTAVMTGHHTAGGPGAFFAALGTVLPSFLVIFALSFVLKKAQRFPVFEYAFNGIKAGVFALIIKALFDMAKQCPRDLLFYIISSMALVCILFGVSVWAVLPASAAAGLAAVYIAEKRRKQ